MSARHRLRDSEAGCHRRAPSRSHISLTDSAPQLNPSFIRWIQKGLTCLKPYRHQGFWTADVLSAPRGLERRLTLANAPRLRREKVDFTPFVCIEVIKSAKTEADFLTSFLQESHRGELQGHRRDSATRAQGDRVPAGDRAGSQHECKRLASHTSRGPERVWSPKAGVR